MDYIIPASKHKYTPDFTLYLGDRIVYVESKGRLDPDARKKMLAVREAHPDVDLRILFQREQPIRKGSKAMYSDWARKSGFQYAFGDSIPEEWLSE